MKKRQTSQLLQSLTPERSERFKKDKSWQTIDTLHEILFWQSFAEIHKKRETTQNKKLKNEKQKGEIMKNANAKYEWQGLAQKNVMDTA